MSNHGVVHVDTGKDIGGGVCYVQIGYQPGAEVFIGVNGRTQICTIGEDGTDDQAYGHAGKQVAAQPVIFLLIPEKEEQQCSADIKKPQKVRDDKDFFEGNHIVHFCVDDVVVCFDLIFQVEKPGKIDECIKDSPDMVVLSQPLFHEITLPLGL